MRKLILSFCALLFVAGGLYSAGASRSPILGDTCRNGPQDQYDDFEWDDVLASCRHLVDHRLARKRARLSLPLADPFKELSLVKDNSGNHRAFLKLAQGGMMPGPGTVHSSGSSPASFTFGASSSTGSQASSPFNVTGVTFNTASADIATFSIVTTGDISSGHITSMTIAGTAATCVLGINNTADEQAQVCYAAAGAQTTATVAITFTGLLRGYWSSGALVTTTSTPSANNVSNSGQGGGVATPFNFACTVPSNGVGVGIIGDFFSTLRSFTSVAPIQDAIINDAAAANMAAGHTATSGSAGITVSGTTGIFPAWSMVCWGP